jgi:hypothetical protein
MRPCAIVSDRQRPCAIVSDRLRPSATVCDRLRPIKSVCDRPHTPKQWTVLDVQVCRALFFFEPFFETFCFSFSVFGAELDFRKQDQTSRDT